MPRAGFITSTRPACKRSTKKRGRLPLLSELGVGCRRRAPSMVAWPNLLFFDRWSCGRILELLGLFFWQVGRSRGLWRRSGARPPRPNQAPDGGCFLAGIGHVPGDSFTPSRKRLPSFRPKSYGGSAGLILVSARHLEAPWRFRQRRARPGFTLAGRSPGCSSGLIGPGRRRIRKNETMPNFPLDDAQQFLGRPLGRP